MRGAGRHPCCCVNKSTRRQRRERQWRKERHQIDSPCLVNDFSHIYLLLSVAFVHILHTLTPTHPPILTPSQLHIYLPCHTLTPAHIPTIHILPSSHPHTCTHTYNATPFHPHTLTPACTQIYLPCHTLTPAHIPPHPSQSWVFLISLRLKLTVTKVMWRRRRMSVPSV